MIENRLIDEKKLENYLGGKDYSSLRIRQQRDKAIHVAFEANCTRFSLIGPGRRPSIGRKSKLNERNCRTILPFFPLSRIRAALSISIHRTVVKRKIKKEGRKGITIDHFYTSVRAEEWKILYAFLFTREIKFFRNSSWEQKGLIGKNRYVSLYMKNAL